MSDIDYSALFKIGYGLYVITSNDGTKDNGFIANSVMQVTDSPKKIAVCINKQNYSYQVVKQTDSMNVNCLTIDTPFDIFKRFGYQSGKSINKFKDFETLYSNNRLIYLPKYINAYISLQTEQYVDLGTHGLFICEVTDAKVLSTIETMTYSYYQSNVKPKSNGEKKKGWICKICGYVYEGDELPEDFICPICKHGASDFEKIE